MAARLEQHKLQKTRLMRVNIFFIVVFLFFAALILRLGIVQIVYGEEYKKEVRRTVDTVVSTPVPRGKIFDRNEKVIVDNVVVKAIIYTRTKG